MNIRLEEPKDYYSILRLTYEAFLTLDYPGRERIDEHYLVSLLRNSPCVVTELCYVAEQNDEIVGHILYTRSEVVQRDGTNLQTITFGPLSVLPKYQHQGIGSALVKHSLDKAEKLGYSAVLIIGVPDYYPKLGFKRAKEYGLQLPDCSAPVEFMAYELLPGALSCGGTFNLLAPEFEIADTDKIGFEAFHRSFIKENYGGTLIFRPFWEADFSLIERWLYLPHIAQWYDCPGDWLNEIRNRYGEFSFIKHFIAELDGIAIGFCQYYDCCFGQEYEDWYKVQKQGEVFSIDYLIGEPDYLHKGYGSEMVRILTSTIRLLGAKKIIVQPEKDNIASRRALEANGYIWNGVDFVLE